MSKKERIQELNEAISISLTAKAFAESLAEYEQAEADLELYTSELSDLLNEEDS